MNSYFFLQTSFNAVIPERNFLSSLPSMRFLTISQILLEVIKPSHRYHAVAFRNERHCYDNKKLIIVLMKTEEVEME